ncbi:MULTISPECIES: tyrosine phosphatase [Kitasatospora]|uniref:Putative tyrosine phosphatase n=1 Tax=Kitasatospora setae (strain ATCC 33774 / DSM 43861 / JCM 3304 / KCC A-0304 / NBRC 14216 / KM-6054) TaxID=452652 RepID=E4N6S1_KITSK|nr:MULTISPECIES: tyrosine phosphatase [Kitasatospora]BAJ26902.1 putative tyrosine phosphatase [Kitasatospora setae KM-6054]
MRPTLFTIDRPGPGRLSTMARPRGGDWLAEEMAGLAAAGVDELVSALTPAECAELGLTAEAECARAAGLRFTSVPIPDLSVPAPAEVLPVVDGLARRLAAGGHVVLHCRAGIGRSSLLAASVLIRSGADPDDAWARIGRARGLAVPDTAEQRAWTDRLPRPDLR